ncbi:MAG: hypothetical protein Q4F49_06270 [Pseudoxanthomonas suwonensis]|nr:hypothetical protein [Pseudoxanthomonas suwonensis]
MARLLLAPFLNWARKLKYPALFKLVAALFVVTLVVPDPIPFIDELLLGLGTLLLAKMKDPKPRTERYGGIPGDGRQPIDGRAKRV